MIDIYRRGWRRVIILICWSKDNFFFPKFFNKCFSFSFICFFFILCVCSRWSGSSTAAPTSTSAATAMGKQRMATSAWRQTVDFITVRTPTTTHISTLWWEKEFFFNKWGSLTDWPFFCFVFGRVMTLPTISPYVHHWEEIVVFNVLIIPSFPYFFILHVSADEC